jgi:hypothetical protein
VTSAFYEPLIERDLAAIPAAAHAFAEEHSLDELFVSVARFAVLAYAPSMHAKRAVMACRAASPFRSLALLTECARYAAESRQPWSEPPILDPPKPSSEDLAAAIASGDRLRAEAWLAAHLDDAPELLRPIAHDDALLMLDAAVALIPLLGEKGRYALLRMPLIEMLSLSSSGSSGSSEFLGGARDPDAEELRGTPRNSEELESAIDRAIAAQGAVDAVQPVFVWCARHQPAHERSIDPPPAYRLARDYAQTLIAHDVAQRLPSPRFSEFLDAVHHNLQHGENFAEWSFA